LTVVSSGADLARPPEGFLRENRLRLSFAIALVEGVLVLVGVIPSIALYVLTAIALAFWFGVARRYRSPSARQASWVFAASQAIAVLVPILWEVTKLVVAILVVAGIAIAALWFLFSERDRT
jgi:hypothetical protein